MIAASNTPTNAQCQWHDGWLMSCDLANTAIRHAPSPNYNARPADTPIELVVLHNISLPPAQCEADFGSGDVVRFFQNQLDCDAATCAHPFYVQLVQVQVSAHFFITRTGEIVQCVSVDHRAWHAGQSEWQGRTGCNDFSIGIELEGTDTLPYQPMQYTALNALLNSLVTIYPITGITSHQFIAPLRKTDPGEAFDWSQLDKFNLQYSKNPVNIVF
jgi:AmpD protein